MTTKKTTNQGFTSEKTTEILTALSKVQAAVQLTKRDQTGRTEDDREYAYSSLGATWEAVRTLAGENGLALVQRFRDGNLHTVLFHTSGEWIDYGDYPLGDFETHNDLGGAISFARRYTLSTVYGVAAESEDESSAGRQSFRSTVQDIINPPSHFDSDPERDLWVEDQRKSLNSATSMDDLRDRYQNMGGDINAILASGNAEDKAAVKTVSGIFDARRDSLASAPRRRTVDAAARKEQ